MQSAALNDPTTWLSVEFWTNVAQGTVEWAVAAIPKVLVVLVLALILLRIVGFACKKLANKAMREGDTEDASDAREHEKRVSTLMGIVRKTAVVAVWSLACVLVLMQIGVDVAPIIAGAGILGLAVGFGAQELVRDVISGFFILLENQVRVGDVAIVNGTGGAVENMDLRTITLRDLAGVVHVFQNGKIESLSNMTKQWSAMVFEIGVAYKEDTDKVASVMTEVAESMREQDEFADKIIEPLELFGVESFDDSAVVVKARIKTRPSEQWVVGREYRRRLKHAFDERKIEMPFPHRTLYWGEASDPFQFSRTDTDKSDSERRPRSAGRP